MHWMQRERLKNLDKIRAWVIDIDPSKIDHDALEKKCIVILGCTRERAKIYISEVLGEDE